MKISLSIIPEVNENNQKDLIEKLYIWYYQITGNLNRSTQLLLLFLSTTFTWKINQRIKSHHNIRISSEKINANQLKEIIN
jgi:hypothetical protein